MKNINKFNRGIYLILTKYIYGRKFAKVGRRSIVFAPMQIDNPEGISLGDNIFVGHNGWLMGCVDKLAPGLVIDNGTIIGHSCHLSAVTDVYIGKNVLFADKVFVSDSTHDFEDIDKPIHKQEVRYIGSVSIGDDSWLGENVCVCGVNIGKHCVIGANSVVTKDIPDYSVAVGSPAKVIKHYDFGMKCWVSERL